MKVPVQYIYFSTVSESTCILHHRYRKSKNWTESWQRVGTTNQYKAQGGNHYFFSLFATMKSKELLKMGGGHSEDACCLVKRRTRILDRPMAHGWQCEYCIRRPYSSRFTLG